jgi:hypothetical protein
MRGDFLDIDTLGYCWCLVLGCSYAFLLECVSFGYLRHTLHLWAGGSREPNS